MTCPVSIVGFTPLDPPHQIEGGVVLARLTALVGPVLISGVSLVLRGRQLQTWMPKPATRTARVHLRAGPERDALQEAAAHTYRAVTGRDPAEPPVATAPSATEPDCDPTRIA